MRISDNPGAVKLKELAESAFNALREKNYAFAKQVIVTLFKQVPKLPPAHQPYVYSMAKLLAAMAAVDTYTGKQVNLNGDLTSPLEVAHGWAVRAIEDAESVGQPWPAAYSFLAMINSRLGRIDEAVQAAAKAVSLDPNFWQGWNNLGDGLMGLGEFDAAMEAFDHAATLRKSEPSLRFNRGLIKLIKGDYLDGFAWYESRWNIIEWERDHGRPFHQTHPKWWGERLTGKRLLVHAEQGHGDVIQQLRYLPWVLNHDPAHVILEVHAPLVRLVQERLPAAADCTVIRYHEPIPEFDVYCPMMTLCHLHKTTLGTIPPAPYLTRKAA